MIKILSFTILLFCFLGCSLKESPNNWQYKSISAFDSYTQNFLSLNDDLAKSDLKRAINQAKKSANLTTLARIYLGKCALNISIGLEDKCEEYKNIDIVIEDDYLSSYHNFITLKLNKVNISSLDDSYKDFYKSIIENNYVQANKQIWKMKKTTSKLLSASLIKEHLNNNSREKLIELASFYGYKKSAIFWLNESMKYTTDKNKLNKISKKISILESN